jgi:hypothetical protein
MIITLNLKPELEAVLFAQAQASGMTVEEFLVSVVASALLPARQHTLSAEERAKEFEAWSAGHRPTLPCPITLSAATQCMKAATIDSCPRLRASDLCKRLRINDDNFGVAREVLGVERKNVANSVDYHRGHQPGVVSVLT